MPRSIPAHAGKPPNLWKPCNRITVYPRPRGEAPERTPEPLRPRGLSPPTRGSQFGKVVSFALARSIPAHAGKPLAMDKRSPLARVLLDGLCCRID